MQNFRLRYNQDHTNLEEPLVFSGGEIHVDISHLPSNVNDWNLRARLQSSDDIMHMVMLVDAIVRKWPDKAGSITIPYFPYARQDRMCSEGQHFGLYAFIKMLATLPEGVRINTYDLHSDVAERLCGLNGVTLNHIKQYSIIANDEILSSAICDGAFRLVAPDKGAELKTAEVASACGAFYRPAFGSKVRDPETGKLTGFDVDETDFKGVDLLIVDDICDGGGTFVGLAEVLKQRNAGKVYLYVTHGIFSKGFEVFSGVIDGIITTTSFNRSDSDKLEDIDDVTIRTIHL